MSKIPELKPTIIIVDESWSHIPTEMLRLAIREVGIEKPLNATVIEEYIHSLQKKLYSYEKNIGVPCE